MLQYKKWGQATVLCNVKLEYTFFFLMVSFKKCAICYSLTTTRKLVAFMYCFSMKCLCGHTMIMLPLIPESSISMSWVFHKAIDWDITWWCNQQTHRKSKVTDVQVLVCRTTSDSKINVCWQHTCVALYYILISAYSRCMERLCRSIVM